jgi:hypothetical protein
MGNYKNIEHDFIDRTMKLITQYESIFHRFKFEEQYNYTLLLNCLLGVIVLPKERLYSHIPNHRITSNLKKEMGIKESNISGEYKTLRDLIHALRNSIAHYSFEIISETAENLIDRIVFKTPQDSGYILIADFKSTELLPFLRYYADWVKSNLIEDKKRRKEALPKPK